MSRRWVRVALAAGLALGIVSGMGTVEAAPAIAVTNPAQNVVPSPSYWSTCTTAGVTSQTCEDAELAAINHARSLEGVPAMHLPSGFASLPAAQQTFVVSNLERVDRGLPPVTGMVDSLNSIAASAASSDSDPVLSSWTVGAFTVNGWSSIWAGDLNPLAADYDWMYDDGWGPSGSYNLDCTSASASGCWGHRDAILRSGTNLITGVAAEQQSRWMSIAQIFVTGSGSYPAFTYAWSDVVGGAPTAPAPTSAPSPTTSTSADPTITVSAPTAVHPSVVVHSWSTSATRRAITATVSPSLAQPVRLRRDTPTGWHTVRRATAASEMTFEDLRPGSYRLVVSAVPGSARSVVGFRLR